VNDVPWETIVKLYRAGRGLVPLPTVAAYASSFIDFMASEVARLFPEDFQADYVARAVGGYVYALKEEIDQSVEARLALGAVTASEVAQIVRSVVDAAYHDVMAGELITTVPAGHNQAIRRRYRDRINGPIDAILQGHSLSVRTRRRLVTLLINLFCRKPNGRYPPTTGVVFAGFGEREVLPSLHEWIVEGVAGDVVKAYPGREVDIEIVGTRASIVPFAQREMVIRFMEGVDPDYQEVVESIIEQVLSGYPEVLLNALPSVGKRARARLIAQADSAGKAMMGNIRATLAQMRQDKFTDPVATIVSSLPKDELAAMAEALVNLTSFKRRVSLDAETVAGPIDVAVISKGDGLIWIKRKHYFAPELNPGYLAMRYGGRR
jgi:hypothetical protein